MKFFAGLWRILAIILTILTIVTAVMIFTKPDFNLEADLTNILITVGVAYLLAFSTIIRFVHKRVFLCGPAGKIFLGIFFFLLGTVLFPFFLIGSIFGRIYRLRTSPDDRKIGARYAEEVAKEINRDLWIASSKVAIDKILDKSYTGLIRLDDGEDISFYRQVSLIKSAGRTYVLLSPADESSDDEGVALAFAIAPYPGTEEISLVKVTNENLYRRIYSIYDSMLAEREMFNA